MFGIVNFSLQLLLIIRTIFYFVLVYSFIRYIFSRKLVDSQLICAALCAYLIIGLMWGGVYYLLESMVANSFSGTLLENAGSQLLTNSQQFNYFSFITLTTLGYGDITPQTNIAATLCQTEAIMGQFFTVVLIARLVGIQVAQEFSCEKE